jgi:hypothetical protein
MVDGPQQQAEDDAEQDAGCEGKGDRPSAPTPGEVARETAQREIQASEAKDHEAGDDQQQAQKEERATKVRHGEGIGSGSCQQSCGFTEKL